MRKALRCTQMQSDAINGPIAPVSLPDEEGAQMHSDSIRRTQMRSDARARSDALRCAQMHSRRTQMHSDAIKCHLMQSTAYRRS